MKNKIILILLSLITVLVSVTAVSAADIYVNDSAPSGGNGSINAPYQTIWDGINNAVNGDTVNIANGTYKGAGNNQIGFGKSFTLQGQSQEGTVLDGEGANWIFNTYSTTGITIKDLTFINAHRTSDGGAIYNTGNLVLINCTFINNTAVGDGGAIRHTNYGSLMVLDCNFINNTASVSGGAISHYMSTGGTVSGCNFEGNKALSNLYYTGGGAIYTNTNLIVNFCRFYNNTAPNYGAIYNWYNQGVYANNNWWGSNDPDFANLVGGTGPVHVNSWIVLNLTAKPTTMNTHDTSNVVADLIHDNEGNDISGMGQLPDGIIAHFLSAGGTFNPINSPTSSGIAITTFTAGTTPGQFLIYGTVDDQTMNVTVNINGNSTPVIGSNNQSTVNAASTTSKTIGMQETGIPINYLIIAILAVISGLIIPKRK